MKPQNAGLVNPFRNISFTFVLGASGKGSGLHRNRSFIDDAGPSLCSDSE